MPNKNCVLILCFWVMGCDFTDELTMVTVSEKTVLMPCMSVQTRIRYSKKVNIFELSKNNHTPLRQILGNFSDWDVFYLFSATKHT